ncbi:hypothetical protein Nepgr_000578 [Nepenthes gracilis]|uniref:Rho GDP-dissociation inhibitor n=1 Tax=Nepenthes gracilis TaxID=150966 RepID=A0AAD3P354_NEPGR|nr:hypothetical protein Nepgr_000578 [Nepenthes gracilis]
MSLFVGAVSSSEIMGFDENKENGENSGVEKVEEETGKRFGRQMSETSSYASEDDDDDDERKFDLGPQFTLKEQLEKDKDDESLRKWKEQLLGSVDFNNIGEVLEPEVKLLSLSILSPGRPDIFLLIPEDGKPKEPWFTMKEGTKYKLRFTFQVTGNIVAGLRYINTVWKNSFKVDSTKEMLGTFSPQTDPYTHDMPEEIAPSGLFARGSYSARSKFVDDDNKCYLEINYAFEISKEWETA